MARRAVRDVRPRAEMCIKMGGVTVEEIVKRLGLGMGLGTWDL